MRLLIDADILVYRAGFAVQGGAPEDENGTTVYPPTSHALHAAKMMVNNLLNKYEWTSYTLYLTSEDKSNFRYDIAKTKPYKGNRTQGKPIYYEAIREYYENNFNTKMVCGQEADDALGIEGMKHPGEAIIITLDKDLDMIPGLHYNFVRDEEYWVSRTKAYRNFCYQLLVGDPVDNIIGARGIGPVKAEKALAPCKRDKQKMLQAVYDLYDDEDLFLEMGRLLWIRRQEGEIWLPDLSALRKGKQQSSTGGGQDSKKLLPSK